jgi:hypothetical protein
MRPSFRIEFVVAATLLACGGLGCYGQAQTGFPESHADGSQRDENGRPHCRADGSAPDGESQCWCEFQVVRGKYRNPKHEYEVQLPDGIAEILDCSGIAIGFHISLIHPESGEGPFGSNQIEVSGTDQSRKTFQQTIDAWHARLKEDREKNPDFDQQFNEPEKTFLSSLPALRLTSSRTQRESEKIIFEQIIANSPDKNIVYSIMMITPADQYERNEKLFREIMEGFRYTANQRSISTPE